MESSRGGPLTTFIMMLPLIVVPTVAMLKPAGNPVGMVTDFLSASPEGGPAAENPSEPGAFTDADEFSDFFDEPEAGDAQAAAISSHDSPFREEISSGSDAALMSEAMDGFTPDFSADQRSLPDGFPFPDDPASGFSELNSGTANNSFAASSPPPQLNHLLRQVQQRGASEVMWFQPGGTSHGFIAFFHKTSDGKILRFEAIAATKAAAVMDVLSQIQQRQRR